MVKKRNFPLRGDIYWVNLDPTIGSETKKTRPGLILSNDIANELSEIIMIAPITSNVRNIYPFEVAVKVAGKAGKIMLNQTRAIDKARLCSKIDSIDKETMKLVEGALKIVFGLD
ncbi:MAG: type II toxin-antitoxin system PemK/MazF family toxin [Chlamydiia bacterium]|nr:type II toxin-antitoxin system PemK/MazF family toxin [Chlamydiia bacterium]